jgi:sugar diacid utilization regulator
MWINPIGSSVLDEPIERLLVNAKQPDTDIHVVSLREGLDTKKAAKRLFIHVNTLRYRLQKIRDLLQENPFGDGNLFKYLIALCSTMLKPDADSTA